MNTTANLRIKGSVELFLRQNGKDFPLPGNHNAFQETGKTAIVNALGKGFKLTHIYFIYANNDAQTIGADSGDLTAASIQALADANTGILKVPVFCMGTEASDDIVDTAVLAAITDPSGYIGGASFVDGRWVYGLGLVQETDNGDVLYAAADITPIRVAANAQVGAKWKTTIITD